MEALKFSAEMAQLIAEGYKVETRRPIDGWADRTEFLERFKPGTEFYVAEPFATHREQRATGFRLFLGGLYKILGRKFHEDFAVFPASAMKEDQARTRLVVVAVRVERLYDIDDDDLTFEGIKPEDVPPYQQFKNYQFGRSGPKYFTDPFRSFFSLWDSLYWHTLHASGYNPVVCVIRFRAFPMHEKKGVFYNSNEGGKA